LRQIPALRGCWWSWSSGTLTRSPAAPARADFFTGLIDTERQFTSRLRV
jgi:hypothetical protein